MPKFDPAYKQRSHGDGGEYIHDGYHSKNISISHGKTRRMKFADISLTIMGWPFLREFCRGRGLIVKRK